MSDEAIEHAVAVARVAMANAHAPYSAFRVGACLRSVDGTLFAGCNVENASFSAGVCAERVALGHAVASGHRDFDLVVVVSEAAEATPPCGVCRQALVEFAPNLRVVSVTPNGGRAQWRLHELLPSPFTTASLARA